MISSLDIVVLVLLVASTAFGAFRGFVRIAVGLAGLALSLAAALRLAERGPTWFPEVFKSDHVARLVAFVLVLVIGLVVTAVAAWLAFRLVQAAEIGWVDRVVGGGFGLAGGILVVAGLLVGLVSFLPPGTDVLRHSLTVHRVMSVVDAAASILPPRMADAYRERRAALDRALDQRTAAHDPQS